MLLLSILASGCTGGTASSDGAASPPAGPDVPAPSPVIVPPGDVIGPPALPAPSLEIGAEQGALRFRWSEVTDDARSVRLHVRDAHGDLERALPLGSEDEGRTLLLPVIPHRTPWADLSYRLEVCSPIGCAISPPRGARQLAADTFHALHPGFALREERYGEAVAFSADGGLLAIAQPAAGRVSLWFTGGESARGGTIDIGTANTPGAARPGARRLALAASGNGDAIAVLIDEPASSGKAMIALFERLGEDWFESARFAPFEVSRAQMPDAETSAVRMQVTSVPVGESGSRLEIWLSQGGDRLAVASLPVDGDGASVMSADGQVAAADDDGSAGALVLHERGEDGRWRAVRSLHAGANGQDRLIAAGISADLRRVFTVAARPNDHARLRLHARERDWRADELVTLTDLDALAPLALVAAADGTRLAIGGFENRRAEPGAAVLWRYRVETRAGTSTASVEESIVLGTPTGAAGTASLVADAALDAAAFAWRSPASAGFESVVRDGRGRWRRTLTLSGDQAGTALSMDAGGTRLAIGVAPGDAPTGTLDAGRVLLLR